MPVTNAPAGRRGASRGQRAAPIFAALGDATRLELIERLARGEALSIARLTQGTTVTRQAVSKHLRVLEGAGLVRAERAGREQLWELDADGFESARSFLDRLSREWDVAIERLKALVER